MSIHYAPASADIFDDDSQAYTVPVNCVGVMGKGLAKEYSVRQKWIVTKYKVLCNDSELVPGIPVIFWRPSPLQSCILFPTKDHWRDPSQLKWIEKGLSMLPYLVTVHHLESVCLPALGCGNGGLKWKSVEKLIDTYLANHPVRWTIYPPHDA